MAENMICAEGGDPLPSTAIASPIAHPWDSPGKNTGVGYPFLLQCIKVKSESEVTQSCPTLSDPIECSLPGFSVHGILHAMEWSAIEIPNQGVGRVGFI